MTVHGQTQSLADHLILFGKHLILHMDLFRAGKKQIHKVYLPSGEAHVQEIMRNAMRLSMDLELRDIPGQLLLALQPLRDNKANIISVVHHRDRKTPRGMIPVRFVVEMDRSKIDTVKEKLKESGISVVRAGEDRFIEAVSVVLVGHVLDSDLGDTINRIDSTGFAEVMDLALTMTGVDEPSSAFLKIQATGKAEIQKALAVLREVGAEKKLLVIEPIETEAV
jgi:ACT domain-containing protein